MNCAKDIFQLVGIVAIVVLVPYLAVAAIFFPVLVVKYEAAVSDFQKEAVAFGNAEFVPATEPSDYPAFRWIDHRGKKAE